MSEGNPIPELQVDTWGTSANVERGIANIMCFKIMPQLDPKAAGAQIVPVAVLRVSTSSAKLLAMMLRKVIKAEEARAGFTVPLDKTWLQEVGVNLSDWENIGGGNSEGGTKE